LDNALLLDTSVVSVFLKTSQVHADRLAQAQRVVSGKVCFISFVTVAELLFWAEKRNWSDKRRSDLDNRLRAFGILDPTRTTAEIWAGTKVNCEANGRPMQPHDLWIAAAALEYELALLTADQDFGGVAGLTVINV
jgi:tRNA(fMet)-specific endonuclease VapC